MFPAGVAAEDRNEVFMKKRLVMCGLCLTLALTAAGCGKSDSTNKGKTGSEQTQTGNASSDAKTADGKNADGNMATPEPTQTPKPVKAKISAKKPYSDASRVVTVLGLKEYKKIKGDEYVDKPKKGHVYLVAFLSVRNDNPTKDYINANYITGKLDGKKIEHTFLKNDPEDYKTIFTHVPTNKTVGGFIVWEVPSDWKKLDVTYKFWKDADNVTLTSHFTRKDLKNPPLYKNEGFYEEEQ